MAGETEQRGNDAMNPKKILKLVGRMGGMKFFPSDEDARIGIGDEIASMCHSEEEAEWLVKRVLHLYPQGWPGVGEMRAAYCASKKPKDGFEAYSSVYLDEGIPSEREETTALPSGKKPELPAGEPASAAPSLAANIRDLARMKDLNAVRRILPADLPVVRITPANRITQADIDRAADALREKRTRGEIT